MPTSTYELRLVQRTDDRNSIVLHDPYDLEDLPDDVVKAIPEELRWWEDHVTDELTRRGLE